MLQVIYRLSHVGLGKITKTSQELVSGLRFEAGAPTYKPGTLVIRLDVQHETEGKLTNYASRPSERPLQTGLHCIRT
jgi:hypothetical protein